MRKRHTAVRLVALTVGATVAAFPQLGVATDVSHAVSPLAVLLEKRAARCSRQDHRRPLCVQSTGDATPQPTDAMRFAQDDVRL